MTFEEFQSSLNYPEPPDQLSGLLRAMWYEGKGDWESSHNIAQDIHSKEGSWIHAYLHRKEGDEANASYWYRKAGQPFPNMSLPAEWKQLVEAFLDK